MRGIDPVLLIVVISVLGPVIGSVLGVLKKPSLNLVSNMLSFAAGVMLAISFMQLIPEATHLSSVLITVGGIIFGSLVIYALDRIIPHIHPELSTQEPGRNIQRTSYYLFLGIFLHNFPEGMAIAIGSVTEVKVSFLIAVAIAIHNIPEGICTSAPYYLASGSRIKSFLISSTTAVPILAGYLLARYLFQDLSPSALGFIVATTAGVMIYITADELMPYSCTSASHQTIFWLMGGIILVVLLGLV
jgi:ZIP family zinc transporter